MIITVSKEDGQVVYDVNKVNDEQKQQGARVTIQKVGFLDTIVEALSFASNTHRANLEEMLSTCEEAIVENNSEEETEEQE